MAGEVSALFASLKGAADIVGGLIAARDLHKFSGELIDLQSKIIATNLGVSALQDQISTLKDQKRELEEKLREFENWNAEAERYALLDFGGESFAYSLKPEHANAEPPHHLCANCFAKRKKSILQRQGTTANGRGIYLCHDCGNKSYLGTPAPRDPTPRRSYRAIGGW